MAAEVRQTLYGVVIPATLSIHARTTATYARRLSSPVVSW
jgi:hypothetical protein